MMLRVFLVLAAGAGLSACQPAIPDSGRGVGFEDFNAQSQQREAALSGSVPAPAPVSSAPLGAPAAGSAEATAAETARVLAATSPDGSGGIGNAAATNSGVEPLQASPSNPAPAVVNGDGISRENNFDAVSAQRSIEADSQRIDANRAQYRLVQPEALPNRVRTGPNIVEFALANTHPRGTQVYPRSGFNRANKYARSCAKYPRTDQAQIAFLEAGGPQRDRLGMDPDGDGFACEWDPAPFRQATQGSQTAPATPDNRPAPVISTERNG